MYLDIDRFCSAAYGQNKELKRRPPRLAHFALTSWTKISIWEERKKKKKSLVPIPKIPTWPDYNDPALNIY